MDQGESDFGISSFCRQRKDTAKGKWRKGASRAFRISPTRPRPFHVFLGPKLKAQFRKDREALPEHRVLPDQRLERTVFVPLR